MTFRGWPAEALEFYEGLEADNSKAYWLANKAVYEDKVLAPMLSGAPSTTTPPAPRSPGWSPRAARRASK